VWVYRNVGSGIVGFDVLLMLFLLAMFLIYVSTLTCIGSL